MTRFVFDTNVIISALLFKQSTSYRAFTIAEAGGIILLSSPVISELIEVINRSNV